MQTRYQVIGLMSGTSLDGLDVAHCEFKSGGNGWSYQVLEAETYSYPPELKKALSSSTTLSGLDLTILDHALGKFMGETVRGFIETYYLQPTFIASHGHTIFHQPDRGFTLQVGNPYEIFKETHVPVVCDFRSLDVALGGQGAPLVPIGDKMLFAEYDFCLNLGGISNISFDRDEQRIAFDICPVNIVLNKLANQMGQEYDKDGLMARGGRLNEELLKSLNSLEYYSIPAPKSLGIEWIHSDIFPLLKESEGNTGNLLHTFCHHIACQIAEVAKQSMTRSGQKMLVTGGGAFNTFLIDLIGKYCGDVVSIHVPDPKIVSFKEALIFAFLGLLRWERKPNVFKSVTGARFDSCGGIIIDNPVSI